jgi:hypothetical protein
MIMLARPGSEPEDAKLTKQFFINLPAGVYLVSNVGDSPRQRSFAEYVVSLSERENQWARIRAARVDQRTCMIFVSEESFRQWLDHNFPRTADNAG